MSASLLTGTAASWTLVGIALTSFFTFLGAIIVRPIDYA